MARAAAATADEPVQTRRPVKTKKMGLPAELAAEFGVTIQELYHTEGLVPTEHVMDLLEAFGIPDVQSISFPFQRLKKGNGEIWRMRIDAASMHVVEGKPVSLHRWIWVQDLPERTASAN
jgi:hypothetical protein